jgi:hypothetical protein
MMTNDSPAPLSVGMLRELLADADGNAPVLLRATVRNGLFRIETIAPAVAAKLEHRTIDPSRHATVLEFVIDAGSP